MPIPYRCPSCQKKFELGDNLAGKSFTCWECGSIGEVPYVRSSKADIDDDEDVDQRPRRRRVKKNNTSNAGLVAAIIIGSMLLLFGLVAAVVYFGVQAMRNDKRNEPTFTPVTRSNNNQQPPINIAPAPKPADESPESKIAKEYSFTREKINLGTPGRGIGPGLTIPYTMQIEPEPDPLANMPQPKFGPKFTRPARYNPGHVTIVTLVEGRFQESLIMGGFFWEKEGGLTLQTIGFGRQPERVIFLAGPGKERISNIIRLPAGP